MKTELPDSFLFSFCSLAFIFVFFPDWQFEVHKVPSIGGA
jgi:hypothetical protein